MISDAAGNLTQDGTGTLTHTYQWDGEGHLASVDVGGSAVCGNGATVCYTYNALGQRVQGVYSGSAYPGTFEWLFDSNGEELSECDGGYDSGGRCWYSSWVRLGGRSIADYWPTNLTAFNHPDDLGSTAMVTVWDGTVATDMRYYPFGQIWLSAGRGMWDVHFAGMQYPETNFSPWLMPTDFRKYHPTLGRWLSPDPLAGDITNPQSLNRYAYVMNNPTTLTDPLGLLPYAGSTPSCGSIPSGIELDPAALAGYLQCQNWYQMWASSGQSEGCMAGEYACGGSGSSTYGEDFFDALAATQNNDAESKPWVDANGNFGFTVNPDPNSPTASCSSGTCAFSPPPTPPPQTTDTIDLNPSRMWAASALQVAMWQGAASTIVFSPGYPGNPNFQPGGFVCVTCGPWTDGGTSPPPKRKAASTTPKPPGTGQTVLFPVPSSP